MARFYLNKKKNVEIKYKWNGTTPLTAILKQTKNYKFVLVNIFWHYHYILSWLMAAIFGWKTGIFFFIHFKYLYFYLFQWCVIFCVCFTLFLLFRALMSAFGKYTFDIKFGNLKIIRKKRRKWILNVFDCLLWNIY